MTMASALADDVLSDADFDAWLHSVRSQLHAIGLAHTTDRVNTATEDESVRAAIHISGHTQPKLLLRVPSADLLNATKLVKHLRALTRPFRFMDLPPELRNRTYDHVLPHTDGTKYFVQFSSLKHVRHPTRSLFRRTIQSTFDMPPVTKVSKQLRAESLSLFATTRHMRISMPLASEFKLDKFIRQWASIAASAYLRQIRHFTLAMGSGKSLREYHLTFSISRGLEIATPQLSDLDEARVRTHIETVEAERKVLGLQGEAIVMAIIRKPELW